ncbi:hypothetical protein [Roseomonas sp. 18066]|uniref:hypothetical protein n=1 Tax=Roseomonas sp. 18066 TaxID=2681412 RepID=UPI00135A2D11|nr:hypothetical protein [Roseomonas sp. 18066]
MRRAAGRIGLAALAALAGCAEPAVLRAPPIIPDMAFQPGAFPVPGIAEPTGGAPIMLDGPATPTAAPRSGPAARP